MPCNIIFFGHDNNFSHRSKAVGGLSTVLRQRSAPTVPGSLTSFSNNDDAGWLLLLRILFFLYRNGKLVNLIISNHLYNRSDSLCNRMFLFSSLVKMSIFSYCLTIKLCRKVTPKTRSYLKMSIF